MENKRKDFHITTMQNAWKAKRQLAKINYQHRCAAIREQQANDIRAALRLLERLANPRGDWRDDEARRKARNLLKKIKRHEDNRKDKP